MKKLFTSIAICLTFSLSSFSQQPDMNNTLSRPGTKEAFVRCRNEEQQNYRTIRRFDNDPTAEELRKKSKNQKIAGIVAGAAGTAVCVAGVLVWADGIGDGYLWWEEEDDNSKIRAGEIMVIAGAVVSLSSIPLFISSAHNRRKADLILKNEHVMITPRISTGQRLIGAGIVLNF